MTDPLIESNETQEAERVLRRIKINSVGAYVAFAVVLVISRGWWAFLGLTCGAAVTMISFLWLEEIVEAILQSSPQLQRKRFTWRGLGRFALLAVALLVTIIVARLDALSLLLGFSIVVVGIIGEAVYTTYKSFAG
jgi:hypothetical protein